MQNLHVRHRLTWDTVKWAFGTARNGNWYPLTWLSHCLDCRWYGLSPAGHHLASVLLLDYWPLTRLRAANFSRLLLEAFKAGRAFLEGDAQR